MKSLCLIQQKLSAYQFISQRVRLTLRFQAAYLHSNLLLSRVVRISLQLLSKQRLHQQSLIPPLLLLTKNPVSSIFQKAARKCTKMHSIGMNSSMLLRWNRSLDLMSASRCLLTVTFYIDFAIKMMRCTMYKSFSAKKVWKIGKMFLSLHRELTNFANICKFTILYNIR